ncbi:MAG: 2-hydroxyacid dehydrogenase, partial [Clostridia bacterium]|nr:2-hydroxyacid dehydrogenase [Clostridia bacterium]
MKFAFFDTKPYDKPSFDRFGDQYGVKFKYFETKLNEDTVDLAHGYDGVCVFVNDTVNATVIDRLYEMGVRVVALRCAGFNNVDMKHAFGKLHVVRVPAYSPYAVAEHAIALLLTSIRRIHKAYIRTKDFNFSLSGMTGFDLHGKTVGVIGTGRIGRVFIDICRGFGMQVLAYDKFPAAGLDNGNTVRYVDMDELLAKSDIISLHCPLTEDTYHLIDANALEKCKRGVVILNTSRGALVDAEALLAGIKSRKVG